MTFFARVPDVRKSIFCFASNTAIPRLQQWNILPIITIPSYNIRILLTFSTWSIFGLAILSWKAGLGEKFRVLIIIVTVIQIVTLMQFVNYSNGPLLREVYSNQHTRDWFCARFIQIILGFPNFPDSFS